MDELERLEQALANADAAYEAGDKSAEKDARRLAQLVSQARANQVAGAGGRAPGKGGNYEDEGQGSLIDSMAQGATFGFADEAQGTVGALYAKMHDMVTGGLGKSSVTGKDTSFNDYYETARDSVRADTEAFEKRNPKTALASEVVGGLLTGGLGAAKVYGTLKNAPKLLKAASVPVIAGAEGATYGFGQGKGLPDSIDNAVTQGATSAVLGPTMNVLGKGLGKMIMRPEAKKIREVFTPTNTRESLKQRADDLYDLADASGVKVKDNVFSDFRDRMQDMFSKKGIDPLKNPKTPVEQGLSKAMRRMYGTKEPTYHDLEAMRTLLEAGKASGDKATSKFSYRLSKEIDNFVKNLVPGDMRAGQIADLSKNLDEARDLWSRNAQMKTMDWMKNKAEWAKAVTEEGNFDDAMSAQARTLLGNEKKRFGIDKEVITSLDKMVKGGFWKNRARGLAGMAPGSATKRGLYPALGAAVLGASTLGPAGALLGLVPPVAGGIAKKLNNVLTRSEMKGIEKMLLNRGQVDIGKLTEELYSKYGPEVSGLVTSLATTLSGENSREMAGPYLNEANIKATELTDMLNPG